MYKDFKNRYFEFNKEVTDALREEIRKVGRIDFIDTDDDYEDMEDDELFDFYENNEDAINNCPYVEWEEYYTLGDTKEHGHVLHCDCIEAYDKYFLYILTDNRDYPRLECITIGSIDVYDTISILDEIADKQSK